MNAILGFESPFAGVVVERLGWVLVHSLWQFLLVALVAVTLLRAIRRSASRMRYGVLLGMMGVSMALPLLTWAMQTEFFDALQAGAAKRLASDTVARQGFEREFAGEALDSIPLALSAESRELGAEVRGELESQKANALTRLEMTWVPYVSSILRPNLVWVVGLWAIGVVLCSLRPFLGCLTLSRLKREGISPASERSLASVARVSEYLRLRHVRLVESTLAQVPLVVGYFRPVVLLPISLICNLSTSQLDAIVAHELTHIRRHDFIVNLVQVFVETLFFYHPAIWWLSNRIRVEREHCCDDLVVRLMDNRQEYGRALIAIAEMRSRSSVLALGAADGALLERVRRIVGLPTASVGGSGWTAVGLIAGALCILLSLPFFGGGGLAAADEDAWGPESNGLRCRVVAEMDDGPAFTIELKNVSDKPLTLMDIRYDTPGQDNFDGKPYPEFFAPHLFAFEFFDEKGTPVPRASREFFDVAHLLTSALAADIAPGESLTVKLRPADFHAPMDYQLAPGSYRAVVHYRGPSALALAHFQEHSADSARAKTWTGDARSNEIAFTIPRDVDLPERSELVWGEPQDGLQAAVEFRPMPGSEESKLPRSTLPTKPHVSTLFHVKNVSERAITFVSETGRQGDECLATDAFGITTRLEGVFFTGWPIMVRWTLEPGEVAELSSLTSGVGTIWKPGKYTLRCGINFRNLVLNEGEGPNGFPKPSDYQQVLFTGDAPITIIARNPKMVPIAASGEIVGKLTDAKSGEPIAGATIACGAVINDSGQGGGANAVTDDEGHYRMVVPSPGIYSVWLKKYAKSWKTAAADDGVEVAAGKRVESNLSLVDGRNVVGSVVGEDEKPIQGLVVSCHSPARPHSGGTQSVRTKADGSFVFALPPGRAYIYVLHDNERPDKNVWSGALSADAHLVVPVSGKMEPIELKLSRSKAKFGDTEWVTRSTPGTEIVRREGNQHITGTVVDQTGRPVASAKVFPYDGPIVLANEAGEFKLETAKGTQLVLHAYASGYHLWTGTPTSGDVLKIVLETKSTLPDRR